MQWWKERGISMNGLKMIAAALGRMCLSAIFILSAINKFLSWNETELSLVNTMNDLISKVQEGTWIHEMLSYALPWSYELLICAALFEIVGGLLIFVGMRVRLGAALLLLFLIPTTFFFHHFWLLQGADHELQMIMFLKNLSIFGGLLIVLAFGKGKEAVKASAK